MAEVHVSTSEGSPLLKFLIEPDSPLEVSELTNALGSLARQYERFALQEGMADKARNARLLIANVAPGSIIVNFIPDWQSAVASVAPMIPEMYHRAEVILKFAKRIKRVLDFFQGDKQKPADSHDITIRDCDDASNIVNPIAQHGGTQSFVTINGDVNTTVLQITAKQAATIVERAAVYKQGLLAIDGSKAQRVAMVWKQLARDLAKTDGKKSPDKAIIAEIDPKPHPVFFTDDMASLKSDMIDNEENPYQKVFFVDVDISRVPGGGVGNYRVTAYHGSDDFEPPTSETPLLSA